MDGPGEDDKPYGSCLVNKFATKDIVIRIYKTLNIYIIILIS